MHRFIKLPSGLVVNLTQVSRVVPLDDTLEVYFAGGDRAVLQREDAEAFLRRSGIGGPLSNSVKVAIFWIAVVAAVILVYVAVRSRA